MTLSSSIGPPASWESDKGLSPLNLGASDVFIPDASAVSRDVPDVPSGWSPDSTDQLVGGWRHVLYQLTEGHSRP